MGMYRIGFTPELWKLFCDVPPHQALSIGTAGQGSFRLFRSLNRRGGVPSGAAIFIITGGMGVSTPIILFEQHDFHGKSSN